MLFFRLRSPVFTSVMSNDTSSDPLKKSVPYSLRPVDPSNVPLVLKIPQLINAGGDVSDNDPHIAMLHLVTVP